MVLRAVDECGERRWQWRACPDEEVVVGKSVSAVRAGDSILGGHGFDARRCRNLAEDCVSTDLEVLHRKCVWCRERCGRRCVLLVKCG